MGVDFSLEGKVALITGGKRGIGKAIALAFAEAGADIAICGRVIEDGELEAVAEEIRGLGRRSLAIQADISQKTDVENLVNKVIEHFGAMDILVNNAGVLIRSPLLELPEDVWDKLIDIDLKGYYLCCQVAGKRMVERKKGNIINVASTCSFKALAPGMGAYSVAKAGVVMLTRSLARELADRNIRVNAIAPGVVLTELSRDDWSNPTFLKQREASIPLGRVAEPSDIVGAALFLASDASNYITGHTILLDGGMLA